MKTEHLEFIQREAKSLSGNTWLSIFKELMSQLYSSRGKVMDQILKDQNTALFLETELVSRLEVGQESITPQKSEYE